MEISTGFKFLKQAMNTKLRLLANVCTKQILKGTNNLEPMTEEETVITPKTTNQDWFDINLRIVILPPKGQYETRCQRRKCCRSRGGISLASLLSHAKGSTSIGCRSTGLHDRNRAQKGSSRSSKRKMELPCSVDSSPESHQQFCDFGSELESCQE
ncbi:Pleckstrin-likey-Like Domain Family B Member 3 [Manis pentadactyla]|nr:Pleckstrin-likey-Like Domain Family B Member 3 [Manis pentadactyla]